MNCHNNHSLIIAQGDSIDARIELIVQDTLTFDTNDKAVIVIKDIYGTDIFREVYDILQDSVGYYFDWYVPHSLTETMEGLYLWGLVVYQDAVLDAQGLPEDGSAVTHAVVEAELKVVIPVATSGDYNDLNNKPELSDVATSGDYSDLLNSPNLAAVATSGNYNDLINLPVIPEQLTAEEIKTLYESNPDTFAFTQYYIDKINSGGSGGGITYTLLPSGTLLTDVVTTGDYFIQNAQGVPSSPEVSQTATCYLKVRQNLISTGNVMQWFSSPNLGVNFNEGRTFFRYKTGNVWSEWTPLDTVAGVLFQTQDLNTLAKAGIYANLKNNSFLTNAPAGTSTATTQLAIVQCFSTAQSQNSTPFSTNMAQMYISLEPGMEGKTWTRVGRSRTDWSEWLELGGSGSGYEIIQADGQDCNDPKMFTNNEYIGQEWANSPKDEYGYPEYSGILINRLYIGTPSVSSDQLVQQFIPLDGGNIIYNRSASKYEGNTYWGDWNDVGITSLERQTISSAVTFNNVSYSSYNDQTTQGFYQTYNMYDGPMARDNSSQISAGWLEVIAGQSQDYQVQRLTSFYHLSATNTDITDIFIRGVNNINPITWTEWRRVITDDELTPITTTEVESLVL